MEKSVLAGISGFELDERIRWNEKRGNDHTGFLVDYSKIKKKKTRNGN